MSRVKNEQQWKKDINMETWIRLLYSKLCMIDHYLTIVHLGQPLLIFS